MRQLVCASMRLSFMKHWGQLPRSRPNSCGSGRASGMAELVEGPCQCDAEYIPQRTQDAQGLAVSGPNELVRLNDKGKARWKQGDGMHGCILSDTCGDRDSELLVTSWLPPAASEPKVMPHMVGACLGLPSSYRNPAHLVRVVAEQNSSTRSQASGRRRGG